MVRVCFYGPESTGKTVLAQKIAQHYDAVYVPEVAREMITSNVFTREDIIAIGEAQTRRVLAAGEEHRLVICDTDLITTQIYSKVYLGEAPNELVALEQTVRYDRYFLFNIDTPWVADGMRDLDRRRDEMFQCFKKELDQRGLTYNTISGSWLAREQQVALLIDELLYGR